MNIEGREKSIEEERVEGWLAAAEIRPNQITVQRRGVDVPNWGGNEIRTGT